MKNIIYVGLDVHKESITVSSYSYTRPGVIHKSVTKTTGVVQKTLEVEAYKSYLLGFDRKAEEFTFEESEPER